MSYRREQRASRSALLDSLEEGGIRAASSPEIKEHDNDRAMDSLQDRVLFLKRLTGDIHEEVESHNRLLDRMGHGMDASRGIMSGTMDRFKKVFEKKSNRKMCSLVGCFVLSFLLIFYLIRYSFNFPSGLFPNLLTGLPIMNPTEPIHSGGSTIDNEDNRDGHHNMITLEEPIEGAIHPQIGLTTGRRSRGRPLGARNRPRAPITVIQDSPHALLSHVMEICSGADIAWSVAQFSRRSSQGVFVLSGSGLVTTVTLRRHETVVTYQGWFEILSLTGSFLLDGSTTGLTVYLIGSEGQIVCGTVVGSLFAVGLVTVVAATFSELDYVRLPLLEDCHVGSSTSGARQVHPDHDPHHLPLNPSLTYLQPNSVPMNNGSAAGQAGQAGQYQYGLAHHHSSY